MSDEAVKKVTTLIGTLGCMGLGLYCWSQGWAVAGTVLVILGVIY